MIYQAQVLQIKQLLNKLSILSTSHVLKALCEDRPNNERYMFFDCAFVLRKLDRLSIFSSFWLPTLHSELTTESASYAVKLIFKTRKCDLVQPLLQTQM